MRVHRLLTSGLCGLIPCLLASVACCQSVEPQGTQASSEQAKVSIGQAAPDFSMTGIDGEPLKLSEQLRKDKYVILMFSRASW